MALSIKTREADRLARSLARLTGESLTEAVTAALRDRLAREQARRAAAGDFANRLLALAAAIRRHYDAGPVTKAEWDAVSGEPC